MTAARAQDELPALDVDLLVVGSGAAGLSAAVTAAARGLTVLVVEKDRVFGGATAWSGGWLWVPSNPVSQRDGAGDDPAAVRQYLRHELGARYDDARIEAFLDAGPRMVDFFERRTRLQFVSGSWIADIHGDTPGAGTGSRSVAPLPLDGRELGADLLALLRPPKYETSLFGMSVMAGPSDLGRFMRATRSPSAFAHAARRLTRHAADLLLHGRGLQLVNGSALVGRLLLSGRQFGVRMQTRAAARDLMTRDGAVVGARIETPQGTHTVRARRGVLLATGGFARDAQRMARMRPRVPAQADRWALPPPAVAGDGLAMAEAIGAAFDAGGASPLAWCPVSEVAYRNGSVGLYPHIIDRAKPGLIAVKSDGRRFVNEAHGYHDYVAALLAATPADQAPLSWLICDQRFQRRYPFGMAKPFPIPTWPYVRSGYLRRAGSLQALARACGIHAQGLVDTVAAYNEHAREGRDPAFGRGSTVFNRRSGDTGHPLNPCVAPLEQPPFYAIEVRPGCFGSFAGLRTDECSRVLDAQGHVIDGLYAAGCDQANVMAGHYPAGGINLGPAMTFGFIAAEHAASRTDIRPAA